MSEEKVEMPVEEETQPEAEEPTAKPAEGKALAENIGDELQQLGRNLTAATRAMLESPEAQEVGVQLHKGLESLEKTVGQLVSQARESTVGQRVESGVSEATAAVKERGLLETLSESFTSALHTVNQTLEQAVDRAQARAEEAKTKKAKGPQQIEVLEAEEGPAEESETSEE